jgi:SAM-dependent methyltransferase
METESVLFEEGLQATLSLVREHIIVGQLSGPNCPRSVTIQCGVKPWATVPTTEIAPGLWEFSCDLPVRAEPGDVAVSVYRGDDGDYIGRIFVRGETPKKNAFGIGAHEILALHGRPFFAIPYIRFDGAQLTISGSHLPPMGDPSKLSVKFDPGVAYNFQYPLKSPSWGSHFWYWPNAAFSDFILTINLAACAPGADPFHFRFTYPKEQFGKLPEGVSEDFGPPYGEVWIPRDLETYMGYPSDPTQLTRVQTWSDRNSVALTGYNAFRTMEAMLRRYGIEPQSGISLLDWGCGHGRVTRHFIRHWPQADILGMDIDADNIAWCRVNLPGGRFEASPLMPPSPLQASSIDAIFSISVMTHLAEPVQQAWLMELARILKPNGLALISFGGPGAVAWSSVWQNPVYVSNWQAMGLHSDQPDPALAGKIDDDSYYRNAAQTWDYTMAAWQKHFEIITILPEGLGNLDFAVMRKR